MATTVEEYRRLREISDCAMRARRTIYAYRTEDTAVTRKGITSTIRPLREMRSGEHYWICTRNGAILPMVNNA